MKLRALLLAALLLGLLTSTVWADDGHGVGRGHKQQEREAAAVYNLRLASGLAAPGQPDPNVTVVPPGGGSQAAVVCTNRPDAWAGRLWGSNWISSQADCTASFASSADYQYGTSFALPASAGPARISGWVLADDSVTVQLNGHTIFAGGGFREPASFASDDSTLFNTGVNTLTFTVHNLVGPTGLDFVANVRAGFAATATGERAWNHGQCVSEVAHDQEPGHGHGQTVSQAARFACWEEIGD